MFTGLVDHVARLASRVGNRFAFECRFAPASISRGASIACDGCCLTATEIEATPDGGSRFFADVSNETLSVTTLGDWSPGRAVNVERSLRAGDEMGGHIVTGHVDGVARLAEMVPDGDSLRLLFEGPKNLSHFIAKKGSIALDGISLTVNEVDGQSFSVAIIPHTRERTTLQFRQTGDMLNMEVDLLARYMARLTEAG